MTVKKTEKTAAAKKLSAQQVVEMVRDTIYEVLEEQLDRKLAALKHGRKTRVRKAKELSEASVKLRARKVRARKLFEAKRKLERQLRRVKLIERKLRARSK